MAESTFVAEDAARLRLEHEELQKKYKLVSDLLTAKPNEHVEFKQFEALLNGEFRAFADAESSLAEEATAIERLERLAERLKELVAFPHLSAKRAIAIGGGFSSGKSAFVNSFIEVEGYDRLLPERIEPATAIPSFVMANSELAIKGFSHSGDTVDIDPALYSQLSHNFIDTFSFNLKQIMPSITVEVPLRGNLFANICLIDTPGYNPGGRSDDRTTAADFLKDRDALIWMIGLDATGTVPDEDLEFLEDLELGSLPLYVVLNKADIKPRGELEAILDEVKDALASADIEPCGISVYSSRRGEEFFYDEKSLEDFFREQNQPQGASAALKQEIEDVFEMYANAILKDERTAKWMTNELTDIDFHLSELSADDADVLGEKVRKLIESQKRDFAPIKEQMRAIRQKMLSAVDEIFRSLNFASPEQTVREEAEARENQEFIEKVGRNPSPDIVYNKAVTDLHCAVQLNLSALAQSLLDQGAAIDAKDDDGRTPLHYAAEANAREAAEVLLKNGADVNAKAENGGTPLHYAAYVNAREVAEVLLQNGADVNAKVTLHASISPHYTAILDKVESDDRNLADSTPLHYAAFANACEVAEVLLQNGADVNAKAENGGTPLHYVALANACEVAEVLLRNGADVNAKGDNGDIPLHNAAFANACEVAEVLLQNGAAIDAKGDNGGTSLHYVASANACEVAEVLLKNGADVNAKGDNGVTPLHRAALANASQVAGVLIQNEADVNAKATLHASISPHYTAWLDEIESDDRELADSTPLHAAALSNACEAAEVLIQNGADVNARAENGVTPLYHAALANACEVAEVLLKNGAAIDVQVDNGFTPLHAAAWANACEVVEVLLKNGANAGVEDNSGIIFGAVPMAYANDKTKELLLRYWTGEA